MSVSTLQQITVEVEDIDTSIRRLHEMEEVWRPVTADHMYAYDGDYRYEVSNLGRVRRRGYWGYKHRRFIPERMMKAQLNRRGIFQVTLQAEGKAHTFRVHRLVAMEFLERPAHANQVIHIDGNTRNNHADNLEWASTTSKTPYVKSMSKAVRQYTKDGVFIAEYASASVAGRILGFDHSTISACCHRKKRRNTSYGYIWRFVTDDEFHKG